jgi:hypothetical protein
MADVRRRDVEERMPPEVRERARRGGIRKGKVTWYAGREYTSDLDVKPRLTKTPVDLERDLREARSKRQPSVSQRADHVRRAVSRVLRGWATRLPLGRPLNRGNRRG